MFTSPDHGSTTMITHRVTSSSDVIATSRQRPISVVSMTDSVQSAAQVNINILYYIRDVSYYRKK